MNDKSNIYISCSRVTIMPNKILLYLHAMNTQRIMVFFLLLYVIATVYSLTLKFSRHKGISEIQTQITFCILTLILSILWSVLSLFVCDQFQVYDQHVTFILFMYDQHITFILFIQKYYNSYW